MVSPSLSLPTHLTVFGNKVRTFTWIFFCLEFGGWAENFYWYLYNDYSWKTSFCLRRTCEVLKGWNESFCDALSYGQKPAGQKEQLRSHQKRIAALTMLWYGWELHLRYPNRSYRDLLLLFRKSSVISDALTDRLEAPESLRWHKAAEIWHLVDTWHEWIFYVRIYRHQNRSRSMEVISQCSWIDQCGHGKNGIDSHWFPPLLLNLEKSIQSSWDTCIFWISHVTLG